MEIYGRKWDRVIDQKVRTNNGGEYEGLRSFFYEYMIKMEITILWMPQYNGVDERMNITLIERSTSSSV